MKIPPGQIPAEHGQQLPGQAEMGGGQAFQPRIFPIFLPHKIFSCLDEKEKQRTKGIEDWIEGLLSGSEASDVVEEDGVESEDARLSETETDQGDWSDGD